MAGDDPTRSHDVRKISDAEIDSLADRLLARAVSCLFDAQPNLKSDMLLAVGCLRELARINAEVEVRVWREFLP
jgi:hypothetical protein